MSEPLSIAVVGVSALLPGSSEVGGFWRDLLAGRDLLQEVPRTHWLPEDHYDPDPLAPDRTYSKRGAFLQEVPFDPLEFGIPPSTLPATDTSQLLALMVAQQVLEDATAGQFSRLNRERCSVILGVTGAQGLLIQMVKRLDEALWKKALVESGLSEEQALRGCERIKANYVPWQEATFPGLLGNVVAGRIANRFDLRGTNCVTDAACASSLAALAMSVSELVRGQSDLVITGGVDCLNDPLMYMCFSKTPALSKAGDCRPFDEQADGTMMGEGLAMFALKRLADAERQGDRIYAVLRGLGSSSDGRSKSVYAPLPEGQARALRRAYEEAGYGPETVELVEAHGTGTRAGDAAEFEGLRQVFAEAKAPLQGCALGSVKSQIGHTKAASGAAGMLKAILSLHHRVLTPTIKVERPNPALKLDQSPFYLNLQSRPWIAGSRPRRAAVSSFGFGGSNFHLTAEEYRGPGLRPPRLRGHPAELVLVSAPALGDLAQRCESLAEEASRASASLPFMAVRSQEAPPEGSARLAVVARHVTELGERLRRAGQAALGSSRGGALHSAEPGAFWLSGSIEPGRVAFVFPGQGSQYLGMGGDLAMAFDEARGVWDEQAEAVLHREVFPPPAWDDGARAAQLASLTATDRAQPAIGLVSLSMLKLMEQAGIGPHCVGGHSFGEVTGLCAAGVLSPAAFISVARRRGELMAAAAAAPGAMTAVSSALERLRPLLERWALEVVVANHNHPQQVVLSGPTRAVEAVEVRLEGEGIPFRRLPVATAFHSPLVASASLGFEEYLAQVEIGAAARPAYGNSEAAPYPTEPAQVRRRLAEQLAKPVRFVEQTERMYADGVRTFVEVGPSAVLTEMIGRTLAGRPHHAVALDRKGKHGVTALLEGLGQLWVAGVPMQPARLWDAYARPPDPALRKQPKLVVNLSGTNYGKPYPPPVPPSQRPPPAPKDRPMSPQIPTRANPRAAGAEAPVPPSKSPPEPAEPHRDVPSNGWHGMPATPALPSPAGLGSDASLAWVAAFQEAQRQTAEAHTSFQQSMAETHSAFLRSMEVSFQGLTGLLGGASLAGTNHAGAPDSRPAHDRPVPSNFTNGASKRPPEQSVTVAVPPPAPPARTPEAPAPVKAEGLDLGDLVLEVVASTTGYPAEMLGMQMDLEADLGIDSIKRVEILAAVRERAPGLREVKTSELATLRTLGQIVESLRSGGGAPVPASQATGPTTRSPQSPALAPALDLPSLVLQVVAACTGYPSEMLGMQMDLEADLGIDSIKRVEILAAVRERAPGLPEVKTSQLAALKTLGQIVAYLGQGSGAPDSRSGSETSVSAPPVAVSVDVPASVAERQVVGCVEAPVPGLITPGLEGHLVIIDDGEGVAPRLAERLTRRGLHAEVATSPPPDADSVIFLPGLRRVASPAEAIAIERGAFMVARALAPHTSGGGLLVVVQDTGGDLGLSGRSGPRAWLAGLSALARTAALEWPSACVRSIDLERGERSADALADALESELVEGGSTLEIGLPADGRRLALHSRPESLTTGALPIDSTSVVVATGGARGVTAASLVALAKRSKARFALLGRTPVVAEPPELQGAADEAALKRAWIERAKQSGEVPSPSATSEAVARILAGREIAQTVAALRAAGSEALYLEADVANPASLQAALGTVRSRLGPITGIVHGAGVLADKRIQDKTLEQFNRVFDTKAGGLLALLDATRDDPLALLCTFSSVAARTGNPGQCDYAMANEVLQAVSAAERLRRGAGCRVVCIGWGPWEGGMVGPSLRAHFGRRGVPLIPLELGAQRFVEELSAPPAIGVQVLVGCALDGAERVSESRIRVDAATQPYLLGHRIAGTAVVPVALVIEWFARAVRAARPDLRLVTLRKVKVLRGIRLPHFASQSEVFKVRTRETRGVKGVDLALELVGPDGTLRYSAIASLASSGGTVPPAGAEPPLGPWSQPAIYEGQVLFHEGPFRAVLSVEGISDEGLVGTLGGVQELGWPAEPWATDPPGFDGVLQLAVLWATRMLGGATLPTGIGELILGPGLPVRGPLRGVVQRAAVHADRAACDVQLLGPDGQPLAAFRGVELHLRPDLPRTLAGPRLAEVR